MCKAYILESQSFFLREIKDLNKRRGILSPWIRWFNNVKLAMTLKLIYRFSTVPTKIPATVFSILPGGHAYRGEGRELWKHQCRRETIGCLPCTPMGTSGLEGLSYMPQLGTEPTTQALSLIHI